MKRKNLVVGLGAILASSALACTANASVFSDNFDGYSPSLNWIPPPANWTAPPPGTVDLIGTGTSWNYLPSDIGYYVDLNGSNGVPGTLATSQSFSAGNYTLSFDLAGNVVGPNYGDNASKTTVITLGSWSKSITLPYNSPLTLYSYTFHTSGGPLSFSMDPEAGVPVPNYPVYYIGNLLDNVELDVFAGNIAAATPLPSTWTMMFAGLTALGFFGLRRQRVRTAEV